MGWTDGAISTSCNTWPASPHHPTGEPSAADVFLRLPCSSWRHHGEGFSRGLFGKRTSNSCALMSVRVDLSAMRSFWRLSKKTWAGFSDGKSPDPSHNRKESPNGPNADPRRRRGIRYGVPGPGFRTEGNEGNEVREPEPSGRFLAAGRSLAAVAGSADHCEESEQLTDLEFFVSFVSFCSKTLSFSRSAGHRC